MVSIANIVGSGDLGIELDVAAVEQDLNVAFTEYDPSNYHGLYVRLVEDGPLITVFRSGNYIISGCASLDELHNANHEFLQTLATLDIVRSSIETGFSVKNVVCTADLDETVDLNTLSITLGLESTEYEPEQFPGAIYRPANRAEVLLIFSSGKVVITGAQSKRSAELAFEDLKNQIESVPELKSDS